MKRSIKCLALATMLAVSLQSPAFAAAPDSSDPDYSGVPTLSPFVIALVELQDEQRMHAQEVISQIAQLQELQKEAGGNLVVARQLQADAAGKGTTTEMPADLAAYMHANNLAYDTTGDDLLMTAEEWSTAISSLQTHLEVLGQNHQVLMAYLNNLLGVYRTYPEGVDTQVSNESQTLTSLARGQSMYGDSDVGIAATALVVGLALGCVATLGAQRLRGKKDVA